MNFSDVLEELGFDALASSSSEGSPVEPQGGPVPADGLDGRPEEGPADDEEVDAPPEETRDPPPDEPVEDLDERVLDRLDAIDHELEEIGDQVESNEATLRSLQSDREELVDRMETIEDHNATLLGVYDRMTEGINPFAPEWDARNDLADDDSEFRYNVIEPPDTELSDDEPSGSPDGGQTADAGGTSFEDLKNKREPEDAAGATDDEAQRDAEDRTNADDDADRADPDGSRAAGVDVGLATREDDPGSVATPEVTPVEPGPDGPPGPRSPDEPYLTAMAATYATDVLLMEWLTMLIETAGPAGTLKTIDYYARINWISVPVKRQIEELLSGARRPDETPQRAPSDLTAEEHNRSFTYIMRLAQQAQLARARSVQ